MRSFSRRGQFGRPRAGAPPTSQFPASQFSFPAPSSELPAPSSHVYERERTVTESIIKPQGPRSKRDRLFELFSDRRFHSAHELEHFPGLSPGDWVVEVRSLIDYGFAFARRGNSLIMRPRGPSEKSQDLSDLLAGIDARKPEDANGTLPRLSTSGPLSSSSNVYEKEDAWKTVQSEEGDETLVDESSDIDADTSADVFDFGGDAFQLPDESDRLQLSEESSGCVLPAKLTVTSTMAFLAQKRQGKSYLAMVLAEEFLRHGLPFVALDPTGVWHGILSRADGTPSDRQVILLGGKYGLFPLRPKDGAIVANMVMEMWPMAFVLDLSDMEPSKQHLFVGDFASQIYIGNSRPLHLFFDEADEMVPQVPDRAYRHQRRCLSVVDRLVRRGGVKGVGSTLITQRPAVINKNVLSQVSRLMILKMVAPHDLGAVEDWMRPVVPVLKRRSQCLSVIPALKKGEVVCVQNDEGAIPVLRFRCRTKLTLDTSRTPTMDDEDLPKFEHCVPSQEVIDRVGAYFSSLGPRLDKADDGELPLSEELELDDGSEEG